MVNRSARIEGISQGGQILISGAVWDKVKDTPESNKNYENTSFLLFS